MGGGIDEAKPVPDRQRVPTYKLHPGSDRLYWKKAQSKTVTFVSAITLPQQSYLKPCSNAYALSATSHVRIALLTGGCVPAVGQSTGHAGTEPSRRQLQTKTEVRRPVCLTLSMYHRLNTPHFRSHLELCPKKKHIATIDVLQFLRVDPCSRSSSVDYIRHPTTNI